MTQSQFLEPEGADLDRQIIAVLKREPRASASTVATEVGSPRAVVARRIRELLDTQSVRVSAAVNPDFLGIGVMAHLSIRVVGAATGVAEWLAEHTDAVFVSLVTGPVDIIAEMREPGYDELHARLAKLREHPDVHTVTTCIYSRVYRGGTFTEPAQPVDVDDLDRELIALLQADGRMGFQALADTVKLSPSAVRARLQRLISSNVIRLGAVEARGKSGRQLAVGVGIQLVRDPHDLMRMFAESPHVDFAMDVLGHYDVVATLTAGTPVELLGLIEELRARDDTVHVDSWLHLNTVKEDFTRLI